MFVPSVVSAPPFLMFAGAIRQREPSVLVATL